MKVTIELPDPPKGYEYTGEYRSANRGEWYLNHANQAVLQSNLFALLSYPILKPTTYKVNDYDTCPSAVVNNLLPKHKKVIMSCHGFELVFTETLSGGVTVFLNDTSGG